MQYLGHTYTERLFIIYLKSKFNWVSWILSGNPEYLAQCRAYKKYQEMIGVPVGNWVLKEPWWVWGVGDTKKMRWRHEVSRPGLGSRWLFLTSKAKSLEVAWGINDAWRQNPLACISVLVPAGFSTSVRPGVLSVPRASGAALRD